MSVIIKFTNQITDQELLLIEIQGSIQHTIESKFNYMYLGKLNKINDVLLILVIFLLGQLHFEYRKSSNSWKENKIEKLYDGMRENKRTRTNET